MQLTANVKRKHPYKVKVVFIAHVNFMKPILNIKDFTL